MARGATERGDGGDRGPARLVLASGSPRRRALLAALGIPFETLVPEVDETLDPGLPIARAVEAVALRKARAAARALARGTLVLAADTVVVLEGEPLGKPRDAADAVRMLERLAGREHEVLTGFALLRAPSEVLAAGVERSRVRFRPLDRRAIEAYVATGEPLDKAGAYGLQGAGGALVEAVVGSRTNVIGLPLERVVPALRAAGVPVPESSDFAEAERRAARQGEARP